MVNQSLIWLRILDRTQPSAVLMGMMPRLDKCPLTPTSALKSPALTARISGLLAKHSKPSTFRDNETPPVNRLSVPHGWCLDGGSTRSRPPIGHAAPADQQERGDHDADTRGEQCLCVRLSGWEAGRQEPDERVAVGSFAGTD